MNFAEKHCLSVNAQKSTVAVFGRKHDVKLAGEDLLIRVKGEKLPVTDLVRNLGLRMDCGMRFREHVGFCVKKSYSMLRRLYSNRKILSVSSKKLLSESLVLSHFNFCDTVYGPCLDSVTANRIQRVQNSCIRFICNIGRRQHVSYRLAELGWLNMKNRRKYHACCFFHKVITSKTPPYLYLRIRFRTDVHNINIRFPHHITPPAHSTAFFERSFSYNVSRVYNDLSEPLKALSLPLFQIRLRRMLLYSQV
jgi:hypothetical protein